MNKVAIFSEGAPERTFDTIDPFKKSSPWCYMHGSYDAITALHLITTFLLVHLDYETINIFVLMLTQYLKSYFD